MREEPSTLSEISMSLREQLKGRSGLIWFWILVAALFGCSLLAFWRVDPTSGGFNSRVLNELGAAFLGAAIVSLSTGFGYYLTQYEKRRLLRERRDMVAQMRASLREGAFRVGEMSIPDMVVLHASEPGRPYSKDVEVRFESASVNEHLAGETRKGSSDNVLDERCKLLEAAAAAKGMTFSDSPGVDVVGVGITRRSRGSEDARVTYTLKWSELSYRDWALTSLDLDRHVTDDEARGLLAALGRGEPGMTGSVSSLRELMRQPKPRELHDLTRGASPWPAKLGTGVTVVTTAGELLLGMRSEQAFVAGGKDPSGKRKVHVVAEGVVPRDLTAGDYGAGSTLRTAQRGLNEELGMGEEATELTPTAFFIDTLRLQPCFSYIARTAPYEEIQGKLACAGDKWETPQVIPMDLDRGAPEIIKLLLDSHDEYVLASNHAKAYLYFAMQYLLGYDHMRDLLRDGKRR